MVHYVADIIQGKEIRNGWTKYETSMTIESRTKENITASMDKPYKKHCAAKQIHESVLEDISADVLGTGTLVTDDFGKQIESIRIYSDHRLVFQFYDGRVEARIWQNPSRRESWTPEMKQQAAMHAGKRYNHE